MNIPVNLFMWILAFLPIAVLLVLMIGFHWGASKAAPVGLLISAAAGVIFYRADFRLIAFEGGKGIWNAMTILIIVLTAILMYQVGEAANAFQVIKKGMRRLLPNELLLILAMGWIFESFLQGITGFGVPVAVGAPLLIGIGMKPVWAVVIPLLGQSWGNTFGTLAAAWDALAMTAGLTRGSQEYLLTALWAGLFLWLWNLTEGLAICWFYGKGQALKKGLPAVLLLSVIQGGGELLLTQVNTTLACFVPACISLIAVFLLGRTKRYGNPWKAEESRIMDPAAQKEEEREAYGKMNLLQAFIPYIFLAVIAIVVLAVEPVNRFLGQVEIGLAFPRTETGYGFVNEASSSYSPLQIFTHASMFLLVSALAGLFYYRKKGWIKRGSSAQIFWKTFKMALPSGIAVICLVAMSRIMSGTGQTMELADGIAGILGRGYVVLAPLIGLLGNFMTGSNMSSNILFGSFQMTTSQMLNVDPSVILGAQTAGGSIGSSVSPSNIVLGTTTAEIPGREGEILKRNLMLTIPAAIVIGLSLFAMICISG